MDGWGWRRLTQIAKDKFDLARLLLDFPRNPFVHSLMFDVVLTAWHFRDIWRDDWKACSGNNASHWSVQSLSHENQVCCLCLRILGLGWCHAMPIWSVAWQPMDGCNILALVGCLKRDTQLLPKGLYTQQLKFGTCFLLIFKLKWFFWEEEVGFK